MAIVQLLVTRLGMCDFFLPGDRVSLHGLCYWSLAIASVWGYLIPLDCTGMFHLHCPRFLVELDHFSGRAVSIGLLIND